MEESQSVEAGEGYENPWKEADRKLSTPPAAENASNQTDETGSGQRFKVAKVQFEPNRPEYSPLKPCKASSVVLESPSSSRPVSMLDVSATIGYATNEAVPMTVFYRNEAHDQRTRPTLQELRKGFDIDHEQQVTESARNVSSIESANASSNEVHVTEPKGVRAAPKFGWLKGVMLRCLLNIWGVMLFLRLTWVVGQAGIGWSTVIILLSALVTVVTTLSMSAVCTNGEVKGGGAYYLISRSLGPEFGGSIGLIFSVANAVAVALYVVGFAETVRDLLKENNALIIDEINDIRVIGVLTVLLLLGVTLIGLEWVVRTQMFLLVILLISIVDVIVGTGIGPQNNLSKAQGFTGYSLDLFKKNFDTDYRGKENFFSVFAVFFPAATGILAGVNISGDLKDAQKAIPKGTLIAILLSTIVYLLLAWMAGACVERDASGIIAGLVSVNQSLNGMTSSSSCSSNTCQYGLINDYQVMEKISGFGPIVTGGIFAATLSSALASLVGAPKTFQALCKDKIFPHFDFFGVGVGPGEEPRRGYILTFLVAGGFIAIGELNIIAPVISNFFLMSYALINYAVFAASLGRSPGWRPSFRYYNMWVSLAGALVCVAIMFLINWWAALVTIVIVASLYKYVDYSKPQVNWGSSAQALTFTQALRFTYRLNSVADHVKNFRPQCLVLTGRPSSRPDLAYLVSQLTKNVGLMVCGEVKTGKFTKVRGYQDQWLKENKIRAFHTICTAPSLRAGVQVMLQTIGLGKLRPNTLILGYKKNWTKQSAEEVEEYVNVIQDAFEVNYGVAILRMKEPLIIKVDEAGGEDDWFLSEEEGVANKERNVEKSEEEQTCLVESSVGQSSHSSQSETGGGRTFRVERAPSPVELPSDYWDLDKRHSDCRTSNSSFSERPTIPDSEINFLAASVGESEAGDVTKEGASAKSDSLASGIGNVKVKAYEKEPPCEQDTRKDQGERAKLLDSEVMPVFQEKQKGTIDVWWLFDDGGLTILLPYLLSLHSHWTGCKLRIFTPSRKGLKTNEIRMANLMKKFRIDFSSIEAVDGINRHPTSESIRAFMKLPVSKEFPDTEALQKDNKTLRNIRLGEMLREHSKEAQLIVTTLPVPREDVTSAALYMSWLEMLSANLPPVLLVRGNQQSVLTFYC